MEFDDVVKTRHSVRAFQDRPVAESAIASILDTVNAAPSAGDLQAYEVVLVRDDHRKRALAHAAQQEFVGDASVVLVFFANPARSRGEYGERGERLYARQDATIAAAYAQLAAHSLGLGTVWVGSFDDERVRRAVEAREQLEPVAMIVIGYAAETPVETPRRSLTDLVHHEHFH